MSSWLSIFILYTFQNYITDTKDVVLASHTYILNVSTWYSWHKWCCVGFLYLHSNVSTWYSWHKWCCVGYPYLHFKCFNIFPTKEMSSWLSIFILYTFQNYITDTKDVVLASYTYIEMFQHDIPDTSDVVLASHTYIQMFQHDIPDTSDVVLAIHTYILNVSTYSRPKRCQVDYPYLYYIRFKIILLTQKMSCWLPILTFKCFNMIFLTQVMLCWLSILTF